MKRALFTSINLLGDGLYTGIAMQLWRESHPPTEWELDVLTLNNYVTPIYRGFGIGCNVIFERDPNVHYDFEHKFDVNEAFLYCSRTAKHLAEAYAAQIGVEINAPLVPGMRCKKLVPYYIPNPEVEVEPELRNAILVSMFSMSCSSRGGGPPNKMLPWNRWKPILRFLRGLGDHPLRFLGAPEDRAPELEISENEYLTGIPINRLACIMREASLLVTVDNGMGHLAASQLTPMLLFYPACLTTNYIVPWGNPDLRLLHLNPAMVSIPEVTSYVRELVPQIIRRK